MKKIIVLSGAPGTGKSTLLKKVKTARANLHFSRSCTDRRPRAEETAVDYEYISTSEFEDGIRNGIFLEHVFEGNVHYGTRKSTLENLSDDKQIIMDLDTRGGLSVLEAYPKDTLLIYVNAPKSIVEQRLRGREEGRMPESVIQARLARYDEEQKRSVFYHYIVQNIDLNTCLEEILNIIDHT